MGQTGFFLAHFESCAGGFIVSQGAAQNIFPVRFLFGLCSFDVLPHPVADLAVGNGVFHHLDELFMRQAGGLEPEAVKPLAEIIGVVGVQFARQAQADFVDVARQIMPAGHDFAGTAGMDDLAHAAKMKRSCAHRNEKIAQRIG